LEIKDSLGEEDIEEVCKIIWCCNQLQFYDKKLGDFIDNYFSRTKTNFPIEHLIDLTISFLNLAPHEREINNFLLYSIISSENKNLNIDLFSYINFWLSLAKFFTSTKEKDKIDEQIDGILKLLISLYDRSDNL
jgi:hypothetical protein